MFARDGEGPSSWDCHTDPGPVGGWCRLSRRTIRGMRRADQILEAAEGLFYARSFDGVGVDEIGRAAGIKGSSIYRHFGSKEEILAVLFNQMFDGLLVKLGEPLEDPQRDLEHLVESFLDFALRHERVAAIWTREQGSLSDRYRREHERRRRLLHRRWTETMARCYPGASYDEIVTCARAMQAILMSEVTRVPGSRRGGNVRHILTTMAMISVQALGRPTVVRVG